MNSRLTADEILNLLELEPKATCGFVRLTFVSAQSVAAGVLPPPFAAARPVGSALYFMVTPGAAVVIGGSYRRRPGLTPFRA